MKKRLFALLISVVLIFCSIPTITFASGMDDETVAAEAGMEDETAAVEAETEDETAVV